MSDVYVYVFDSLRADYVGGELTPHINALAKDGATFMQAFAPATWSHPSAFGIMTGIQPGALGKFGFEDNTINPRKIGLPITVDTLATLFKAAGYHTSGFTTNPFFSAVYGIDRGFDDLPNVLELPYVEYRKPLVDELAPKLTKFRNPLIPLVIGEDLIRIWQERRVRHQKTFTVIWSMDTHDPFYDRTRLENLASEDLPFYKTVTENPTACRELYPGMVHYADAQFGKLIQTIKDEGSYDDATIVVLADHGEGFGDKEQYGHAAQPYDDLIHVPLIIKFPDRIFAGHPSDALVSLLDILPTLCSVYKMKPKTPVHGIDLTQVLAGNSGGHEAIIVDDRTLDEQWRNIGVRTREMKYIYRHWNKPVENMAGMTWRDVWRRLPWHLMMSVRYPAKHPRNVLNSLRAYRDHMQSLYDEWVFDLGSDPEEMD
ncbi:MAG: sulfatase, partial [Chloroflexi bacterium]|nr:sulfatase [Chloroflexota bacterium]